MWAKQRPWLLIPLLFLLGACGGSSSSSESELNPSLDFQGTTGDTEITLYMQSEINSCMDLIDEFLNPGMLENEPHCAYICHVIKNYEKDRIHVPASWPFSKQEFHQVVPLIKQQVTQVCQERWSEDSLFDCFSNFQDACSGRKGGPGDQQS